MRNGLVPLFINIKSGLALGGLALIILKGHKSILQYALYRLSRAGSDKCKIKHSTNVAVTTQHGHE